jgi:hypothetical protein
MPYKDPVLARESARRSARKMRALDPERFRRYQRDWGAKNPGKRREHQRNSQIKAKYGMTSDEYEAMHATQGGVCAICGKPETACRNGRQKMLAVDHDHEADATRQLLCTKCNVGLGAFGDDVALMRAAVAYIERHREGD